MTGKPCTRVIMQINNTEGEENKRTPCGLCVLEVRR